MRGKILKLAGPSGAEGSQLKLDDDTLQKTDEVDNDDEEEPEPEAEPESDNDEDKTDTINLDAFDNSNSYINTSRTKIEKIDFDLI